MRKRNIQIIVRLNEKEKAKLIQNAKNTGLPRETYIRALLRGFIPKETPPVDYHLMMRKLNTISESLAQIAARARANENTDAQMFLIEAERLRSALLEIQAAVTSPERIKNDGNDSDMGYPRPP